jgi:hypothetical protein
MEICAATFDTFAHAVGSTRLAMEWHDALKRHAEAVVLREGERDKPWATVAAWPAKQTRRDLPRDIRRSCVVNRDRAADIANGILFDLITDGRA